MRCHFIREQRHVCGPCYQEVDLFPITTRQHNASLRAKKSLASTLVQKNLNEKNARRYFTQKAHANFTEGDRVAHLTYNNKHEPKTFEEAARQFSNFIGRVNHECKKRGMPPIKYMGTTEKKGKRSIRFHHHVLIGVTLPNSELRRLWAVGRGERRERLGGAKIDELDFEGFGGTISDLCYYMTKDPEGRKRWTQSKGLKQPERPRPNDGKYTRAGIARIARERLDDYEYWRRKYPGWELVEPARSYYNDFTGWSVYAKLRPTQPRARPKPRRHNSN